MLPFPHVEGKSLADVSTLGIGGPARYFSLAHSPEEMATMLGHCHRASLPFFILGKGSNCLFDDQGFNGLVIQNHIDYLKHEGSTFTAGGGYSFARLGKETARKGFTGLEFAAGIPATVGGAIYMNAGASGQETEKRLKAVTFVTEAGEIRHFQREELVFSYRTSPFQKWRGAIVEGVFELEKLEEAKKNQRDLLDYRLKTQPYKDKSAGCAFRNPPGTAAGRLIEECGLKGMQIGGARVSSQHANFIVNVGGSTAADFRALLILIQETIYLQRGIHLETEICQVPYDPSASSL